MDSAVVASPHPTRGEIVKAFIILSSEYTLSHPSPATQLILAEELQTFCRKEASPYKYPREIEFVTELPKTVSGKIRRVELRDAEYEVSFSLFSLAFFAFIISMNFYFFLHRAMSFNCQFDVRWNTDDASA